MAAFISTPVFQAYCEELDGILNNISINTVQIRDFGKASDDQGKALITKTEKLFTQSNEILQQLGIEARSVEASKRKALGEKTSEFRSSLNSAKSDFERAKEACQRSALIGDKSIEQRQKLLNTNDKVNRQTETLMAAQRSIGEMEDLGQEITKELASSRDKIKSANDKVDEFSGLTGVAKSIVLALESRETQQKFLVGGILVAISIAIIVTICHFYAPKPSQKPSPQPSSRRYI